MSQETSFLLTENKYGVKSEGIPIIQQFLDIDAPTGQKVHLKTATFNRSEKPQQYNSENVLEPIPNQQTNGIIFLSGFGSRGEDWPVAFEGLGRYWNTVVGLDHPDAPTSTITPHDKPLNNESFANSGYIILRAIEAKIKDGTLKEGITAVGLSTGCPVLLEAVAHDIREADQRQHARYIKSIILTAPAGMMNRKNLSEIAAGATSGMKPYFIKEYGRDLLYRITHPFNKDNFGKIHKQKLSFSALRERLQEANNNPAWKDVLKGHKAFEIFEYIAGKLPIDNLMAYFHRVWPNQDPHLLPPTPSIKQNESLIWHNVTEDARNIIHDTDIRVELFDGDKAVPPEGFLTESDHSEIKKLTLDEIDPDEVTEINHRRQVARDKENIIRIQQKKKPRGSIKPYTDAWILENKKEEITLDRIVQRVKDLFPNNSDRTKISINIGTTHITPKIDIDLIADSITAS